ncbi:MAG: hypothetical protein KA712_09165 [Myxococcales bacterium]|nr:hypothetical protein [Myxococcales bacterium]
MATLSTAAWVFHDLGIAAGLGGTLFGRMAMHPATRYVSEKEERGRLVQDAWRRFNRLHVLTASVVGLTWIAGRLSVSGRALGRGPRALVLAKDALVAAGVLTTFGSAIAGRRLAAQAPSGGVPVENDGYTVSPEASRKAKRLSRVVSTLGATDLLVGIGIATLTTILAMKAGQSSRWSVISRALP